MERGRAVERRDEATRRDRFTDRGPDTGECEATAVSLCYLDCYFRSAPFAAACSSRRPIPPGR